MSWTSEREKKLISLYNSGKQYKQIARTLRISTKNPVGTVSNKISELREAKKIGRRRPYQYWSESEINRLRKMHKNNTPRQEIAEKLDRTVNQVRGMLERI